MRVCGILQGRLCMGTVRSANKNFQAIDLEYKKPPKGGFFVSSSLKSTDECRPGFQVKVFFKDDGQPGPRR